MNGPEQFWRERINWVQASGLTIAAASAEPGVFSGVRLPLEEITGRGTWQLPATDSETEQEAAEKRAAARKKKHALPAARKSESSVKTSAACSNSCPLSCTFTIITERSMAATAGIAASRCLCCRTIG
jgi:hypothetical protein